jgi:hypothetical protein
MENAGTSRADQFKPDSVRLAVQQGDLDIEILSNLCSRYHNVHQGDRIRRHTQWQALALMLCPGYCDAHMVKESTRRISWTSPVIRTFVRGLQFLVELASFRLVKGEQDLVWATCFNNGRIKVASHIVPRHIRLNGW